MIARPGGAKKVESDRTHALLKKSLLECKLRPGEFLSEVDLARACKTSRTPIREACNRLAQEGWITRIPHRGYVVKPISIRDIVEIYEYRKLLECHTASTTAGRASAGDVLRLQRIIAAERQTNARMQDILAANETFHKALAEISNNQRILSQLKLTLEYVHRLDILSTQKDAEWVPHNEILKAIEARNSIEAGQAMARHIDRARDRMLRLFGT